MADVTWGVKVPEKLKEQINDFMQESGLQGKDFMQQLVNLYTLEKTKEVIPEVAEDLKELQSLTQRINNIYLSIGYRIDNLNKIKEEEIAKELGKKDLIIGNLQEKLEDFNTKYDNLVQICNDKVNQEIELNTQVNQLTDNTNNLKALNEEYKGKIDTLSGIIDEYKGFKVDNDNLKLKIKELTKRIDELCSEINDKDTVIEKLNKNIENLQNNIVNLKSKHENEISTLKEKLELEKEKALLEIEKKYQSKVGTLRDDYNNKVNEYQDKLDNLQNIYNSKLEEYQKKYLELLNKEQ